MASLLNMSGGSLLKKGLPYDAEIEYLESSGTQYIDTGFIPDNTCGMYIFCLPNNKNNNIPIGCRASGDARWWINFSEKVEISWNTWQGVQYTKVGVWYEVTNNYLNSRTGTVNGVIRRTNYPILQTIQYSAILFGARFADGRVSPFNGKISNAKISKELDVFLDFIPVRVGQVGYMYDKVSGQLFGNAGTGNFILGADKH